MKNFVIYNRKTGEITQSGVCQDHMILKQPRAACEAVMIGRIPDQLQQARRIKIIDGRPCIVRAPNETDT